MAAHSSQYCISHVVTLLPLLCLAVSAFTLPGPSGGYNVSIGSTQLTDHGRLDPFAPTSQPRSVMISLFSPVDPLSKHTEVLLPYMPPSTAAVEDEQYAPYGVPNNTFQSLDLLTYKSQSKGKEWLARFPVVLFSPALGTSRLLYSVIAQSIASHGYLVVSVDHPYDANVVELTDGKLIFAANITTDAQILLALKTRTQDIGFVLNELSHAPTIRALTNDSTAPGLNVTQVVMYGHSLGGAAVASAMLADHCIVAGTNLDGTFFGPVVSKGLDRPFLIFGHQNKTQATDPSWKGIWPNLRGWKLELMVKGTEHYAFSDFPVLTDALGLSRAGGVETVLGTIKGSRALEILTVYLVAFFESVLLGKSEKLLDAPSKQFKEVEFVAFGHGQT